jgi:D-alanyl-D-alanine carboxypeptidase
MKTVSFHKDDIHKGSLVLINRRYPMKKDKTEQNISLIPAYVQDSDILLESKTASVLSHLIGILRCKEDIIPVSGYRSYEEQERIFTDSLLDHGKEFTYKYVALPNHSEHQTGLAIDLALKQDTVDFICPEFPYEGVCKEFRKKAPLHGFVERYQSGKEKVTGIAHEPWHFRYVGYPHSVIMQEKGFVLEEYMEFMKAFPYEGEHYVTSMNNQVIEIFYVNASSYLTTIELPEDAIYQTSGNNVDGFIVTLWR